MESNTTITGTTHPLSQFAIKNEDDSFVFGDRAITYNRCSSDKQDSVEWQEKITGSYVLQNNWKLIKSFGEKESAKTDDRAEFQEMLKFCRKENISHIVFFSYDRFSRAGNLNLIDELRDNHGIKVHSATQYVDDETAGGRLMQKLYLLFAQMENEDRRTKIIEGQRNKVNKGEFVSKPPLGYNKRFLNGDVKQNDLEKKQCYINETGKLIRLAFVWKDTENLPNVEILRRLESMGLKLKLQNLTTIFKNPFYCGYIRHKFLQGQLVKGKHEPIIDEDTFLRVNGIQNAKNGVGRKNLNRLDEMPFKGTVKCGKCFRPLTGYFSKTYLYYKCPNTGCCVNLNSSKLTKLFVDQLSLIQIQPVYTPLIKQQLEQIHQSLQQNESVRVKPMKDELARLKTELEAIELNFATGKISTELFEKHSAQHHTKITNIEGQLEKLCKTSSNFPSLVDKALEIAQNLLKMWENLDFTGKVRLQKLVYPDGVVYDAENGVVLTPEVNPIFSVFSSISKILPSHAADETTDFNAKSSQLYLTFGSSNFLLENLEKIAQEGSLLTKSAVFEVSNTTFSSAGRLTYTSTTTKATKQFRPDNNNLNLSGTTDFNGYVLPPR